MYIHIYISRESKCYHHGTGSGISVYGATELTTTTLPHTITPPHFITILKCLIITYRQLILFLFSMKQTFIYNRENYIRPHLNSEARRHIIQVLVQQQLKKKCQAQVVRKKNPTFYLSMYHYYNYSLHHISILSQALTQKTSNSKTVILTT